MMQANKKEQLSCSEGRCLCHVQYIMNGLFQEYTLFPSPSPVWEKVGLNSLPHSIQNVTMMLLNSASPTYSTCEPTGSRQGCSTGLIVTWSQWKEEGRLAQVLRNKSSPLPKQFELHKSYIWDLSKNNLNRKPYFSNVYVFKGLHKNFVQINLLKPFFLFLLKCVSSLSKLGVHTYIYFLMWLMGYIGKTCISIGVQVCFCNYVCFRVKVYITRF